MSKVFKRILYKQVDTFITTTFSPHLCGFRKKHNTQYSPLKMIETWKKHLDNRKNCGPFYGPPKGFLTSSLLAIMNDFFFSRQNIYYLRKFQELSTATKNTVNFRMKTTSHRGPQLWNLIFNNIKSEPTLELLKKKKRQWKCEPYPCRMCKTYLQHIGFII